MTDYTKELTMAIEAMMTMEFGGVRTVLYRTLLYGHFCTNFSVLGHFCTRTLLYRTLLYWIVLYRTLLYRTESRRVKSATNEVCQEKSQARVRQESSKSHCRSLL